MPESLDIPDSLITKKTQELIKIANRVIEDNGRPVKIVSDAEISCLALSSILSEKKIENMIMVDERTTRLLSEKPQNLEKLMSHKLHHPVKLSPTSDFSKFKEFRFIRSTELVYIAYKKKLCELRDPDILEAMLYAVKYKGTSVSEEEVQQMVRL